MFISILSGFVDRISDYLKIGHYRTDHATQLDFEEIAELKELAIVIQALIEVN